jgi:aspartyl protease family protein
MRRLLAALLIAISAAAHAASLDPGRIAAIDQAAKDFLARAAEAKKSSTVPRQSDPAVGALLDTVFDTRDLTHGPLPYADFDRLDDWETRIVAVGQVYVVASRPLHDLGIFGPEVGRYFDAAVVVMQAMADTLATESDSHPGENLPAAEQRKIADMHATISGNLNEIIGGGLGAPGLSGGWIRERLGVLVTAAPSFARFLKPGELERLRQTTIGLAKRLHEKSLRGGLGSLAVAFSEPRAPIAPAPGAASASDEIALDYHGRQYTLPVRVNGATTVNFVLDSGASVVSLPQDLVEDLTKAGAIAAGDMRGRNVYVTADGKRHRGTWLMLRQLDVGGHTVTNVMASIAPAHADPLLGQTFLAKFKSWTLDNKRHVLVISE